METKYFYANIQNIPTLIQFFRVQGYDFRALFIYKNCSIEFKLLSKKPHGWFNFVSSFLDMYTNGILFGSYDIDESGVVIYNITPKQLDNIVLQILVDLIDYFSIIIETQKCMLLGYCSWYITSFTKYRTYGEYIRYTCIKAILNASSLDKSLIWKFVN